MDDELRKSRIEGPVRVWKMFRGGRLHVDAGIARPSGRDEWLRGIDGRDGLGAKPRDQLGGERARPAPDVDHALAAAHTRRGQPAAGRAGASTCP